MYIRVGVEKVSPQKLKIEADSKVRGQTPPKPYIVWSYNKRPLYIRTVVGVRPLMSQPLLRSYFMITVVGQSD